MRHSESLSPSKSRTRKLLQTHIKGITGFEISVIDLGKENEKRMTEIVNGRLIGKVNLSLNGSELIATMKQETKAKNKKIVKLTN